MESAVIETLVCPLETNFITWKHLSGVEDSDNSSNHSESTDEEVEIKHDYLRKHLSLESCHISSNHSKSADEETDIKHNYLRKPLSLESSRISSKHSEPTDEENEINHNYSKKHLSLESSHTSSNNLESAVEETEIKYDYSRKHLSVESFHTSSNNSESVDEETEVNHNDDLVEQLNNISFYDVSDSKYVTSKCSNKITEINSETLIFGENQEIEESQFASSSLKYEEALKCVVEADVSIKENSNKRCEIDSKKKNTTDNLSFVEYLENVENQLSSLSLKNNKLLNKCYKSGSDISAGDESDSDDDDEKVETVVLRERDPTRHNRPENNKQQRTVPFSRNHSKNSKPHLNSSNSQTTVNFPPHILNDFNTSNDGYALNQINSTNYEGFAQVSYSNRIFNSCFPTSESVTGEGMVSGTFEPFNAFIPCGAAANQIVNGVNPYTMVDEAYDNFVPSAMGDIGNASGIPTSEKNDFLYFDDLNEKPLFESNNTACAVTDVDIESFFDSNFQDLTAEVENVLNVSTQNYVDLVEEPPLPILSGKEVEKVLNNSFILNQNICSGSTSKEISYQKNNQQIFHPGPDQRRSKANIGETFYSDLNKENSISEKSDKFYNSEYLVNKTGNYSNLVCKNVTSINCESLSPKTSDYSIVSNEIEHEIIKWKEMEEWVKKGPTNVSELPQPTTEISWDMFPFVALDDNSVSECMNTSENKMSCKKNKKKTKKRKQINPTSKSICKVEETKICWMLGTAARDRLFHSPTFRMDNWERENAEIREEIESGKLGTEEKKVIHVIKKNRKTKYRGTNLHYAIRSENTERVFCIVECHKEYHDGISEINLLDSFNKTVLDYSKERGMNLLSDYLEENLAKEWINV